MMPLGHRYRAVAQTDLGDELQCSHRKEFWPSDTEFFRVLSDGRPASWCRACENDQKRAKYRARSTRLAVAA